VSGTAGEFGRIPDRDGHGQPVGARAPVLMPTGARGTDGRLAALRAGLGRLRLRQHGRQLGPARADRGSGRRAPPPGASAGWMAAGVSAGVDIIFPW
jgi:hypothetical protein